MRKLNPNAPRRENRIYRDLTQGSITKGLLLFAAPMVAGNLLQQLYNIADTLIVGQALASVGSAFTLMTFLPSVFLGLSMGSGALFSIYLGRGSRDAIPIGWFLADAVGYGYSFRCRARLLVETS